MRNIILVICEALICFIAIIILSKKYKTDGLYAYGIIATFMSCIMNIKKIDVMGISVPVGFGVTTSIILVGNLLAHKKGLDSIKTYIILIIATFLISCCFLNLSGIMKSSDYNLYANESYNNIFEYNLRIYIGLIVSICLSVILSSRLYHFLRRLQNNIILNNIFSIIIIEFIENIIFVLIAYLLEYDIFDVVLCIVFRYTFKVIIGIFGSIPLYIDIKLN